MSSARRFGSSGRRSRARLSSWPFSTWRRAMRSRIYSESRVIDPFCGPRGLVDGSDFEAAVDCYDLVVCTPSLLFLPHGYGKVLVVISLGRLLLLEVRDGWRRNLPTIQCFTKHQTGAAGTVAKFLRYNCVRSDCPETSTGPWNWSRKRLLDSRCQCMLPQLAPQSN